MPKAKADFDLDEWSNLGNILVRMGELTGRQLARAMTEQSRRHGVGKTCQLGKVVVDMGFCEAAAIDAALVEQKRHRAPVEKPAHAEALARVYAAFDSTSDAVKELQKESRGVMHLKISPNEG